MPQKTFFYFLKNIFFLALVFSACTIPRKVPQDKPFVFRNTIDLNGGDFTKDQRNSLKQKLFNQLDDSAKTNIKDFLFFFHFIKNPPVYDSGYAAVSARNIRSSLLHLGYYAAQVSYEADTIQSGKQERVYVKYTVEAGNPTIIDTLSYRLRKPELQELALSTQDESLLAKGNPVSKASVLGDISRLVELYRNNGYYKFTSDDLKVRGDTTIAALTTITDDPFENLQLLEEATLQREKPRIKLAMILNPVGDSLRLRKYHINKIYIYPDYLAEDATNSAPYTEDTTRSGNYIIRYHKKLFKNSLLARNMTIKPGDIYRLDEYNKTLGNFSKTSAWQNANIQIVENKDSIGKIDMIVQLLPAKKFGFEANIEASYSANSNTNSASIANAGNLLGLSNNVSLQNRNVGKSATKMTHALRAGIELNLNSKQQSGRKLNSTELSYTNTISFPRLIGPIKYFTRNLRTLSQQTFINIVPAYTNRINLFNQLSASVAFGNEWSVRSNRKNIVKFPNIEYSYLYNQSDSFKKTLAENPYLRYSFNTALVVGASYGYTSTFVNARHPERQRTFKWNIEESGLLLGRLNLFNSILREFVKTDVEYTYVVARSKSASIFRGFVGIGIPVRQSDTALPFFKQYFAGGPNSMRAWPIRGIGPGSKALAPYNSATLNDRTGDVRLELNGEYRYDIAQIIPNSLTLKGALFIDAGNVWNFRNTNINGSEDSLQFKFKNLYKQLGVSAGTGFRLDFNYFLIRFDLAFRFKRPDIAENYGWQLPEITFKNLFARGEEIEDPNDPGKFINDERYRIWRYENFNFTIGLSYPF